MDLLEGVEVLCHNSIRLTKSLKIYIDPYKIDKNYNDADYVFCTHEHYDHFSPEDIKKVINENSVIVTVPSTKEEALKLQPNENKIITVKPNEEYKFNNFEFYTVVSYNKNKLFHQKEKQWVGYVITIDDIIYFITGDTDNIEELEVVKCDIIFIPVGGTYTCNSEEAADLVNKIKPKIAIPTHYNCIVGNKQDAENFKNLVDKPIKVELLIK